ncbi:hypothetical protein [Ramlibacter montanisoli]|uniref:Uncharacterized protein n=1 Tax=Ramlibacter montanisoli TaxID=2732512 RepID=A0A849KL03_9BURK|nr:hypothetical protein [Ramlibacter montanisoli]NNU45131.1 hypothetical protein [Ramlibacter montanisoli]
MPMSAEYRKLILAAVLSAAPYAAQAQPKAPPQTKAQAQAQAQMPGEDAKTQAQAGAVADGVSSFVGIAAGTPINPLLPVLGVAFKAATFHHAESLPEAERPRAYAMAAAGWQGSAAGNACAAVSILSGGSFLPACLLVGVGWGWKTWNATERERLEAERCAAPRTAAGKPKPGCVVKRPRVEKTVPPVRTFLAAQDLVAP